MSSQFPIIIKNTDGNTITLMVSNGMQIKEVKELYIQKTPGSSYDELRTMEFFFKGRTLKNDETIGECKIKAKNTLSLLDMYDNIEAGEFR